jgi:hypothetical protein
MADDIKKINDEINKLRSELKQKPLKPFNDKDLETAKALLSSLRAEVRELSSDLDFVAKSFKDSVNELSKQNIYLASAKKQLSGISDISKKVLDYRRGDTSLSEKQLKNLQQQAKSKFETLKYDLLSNKLNQRDAEEIRNALEYEDEFNEALKKTIQYQKEVNQEIGLLGTGLKGIGNLLSKAGFGDLVQPLNDAIEKTKNARLQMKLNKEQIGEINELQELQNKNYDDLTEADVERFDKLSSIYGIDKQALDEKKKSLKDQNKELDTQTNKYKNIGQTLKDQLTTANIIDTVIKEMANALLKADKSTGELAKSFGTSYSEAASLRNELSTIANLSNDININVANLQDSLIAVNKEFGTAAMLSGEFLTDFTHLTKVMGYSSEAAAGLSRITLATGTDLSDNTSKILGQAQAFNKTNKLALNEKEIVEEVAKASAATTISLGMQTDRIARAVLQAKAFGATLEQIERSSQSLLNFESSIASELEAELLTGKNINLERARMYAINNDIEGVAREISREVGSAAAFGEMNVIQQEALAKSVGMEREELSKALIEREAIRNIGVQDAKAAKEKFDKLVSMYGYERAIKELGDEKYAKQLASQSIQERFNASVEKLREIFISIAEPVLQIVSPFMDLLNVVIPGIMVVLSPLIEGVKIIGEGVQMFVNGLKEGNPLAVTLLGIITAITAESLMTAIFSIFASLAKIPLGVGLLLAGTAVAGMISLAAKSKQSMGDGEFDNSTGNFQITSQEGKIFEPSDNDQIAVGPTVSDDLKSINKMKAQNSVAAANTTINPNITVNPVVEAVFNVDGKPLATAVGNYSKDFYNTSNTTAYVAQ